MMRQRQSTTIRQKQIIDAACDMIARHGGEHVTIKALANRVGFSEAAIYRHFQSKADILYELVQHIEINLIVDIDVISSRLVETSDYVKKVLSEHILAIEQRKGVSYLIIAEIITLGSKKLNTRLYEVMSEYLDKLTMLVKKGIANGELRNSGDSRVMALQVYGLIYGLVSYWTLSNFSFSLTEEFEALWKQFQINGNLAAS